MRRMCAWLLLSITLTAGSTIWADGVEGPEEASPADEAGPTGENVDDEGDQQQAQPPKVPIEDVVEGSSGKTFARQVEFVDEPRFRLVSKELANGRPKYDYFIYIKAKLNGLFDLSGGLQEEDTFNVGKIDVWGTDDSRRFSMDMYQSQVRLRGQNETTHGPVVGYLEGDFWGGDKGFRLRHLWIDYRFIHFGQDWSFFGDKEIWPNVFDWDGPPSGVWRREPELRFVFRRKSGLQYEIGIANPGAELALGTDIDDAVEPAYQSAPDLIGALNKETRSGHVRVTAIYRTLGYKTSGTDQRVSGYGATVSGYVGTGKDKRNPVQFQLVAGKGIATYLVSFSGLNYDAAPDGNGNMKAIPTYGGWASYEHWFSKKWHGNLVAGLENFESHKINSYTIPGPDYQATDSEIEAKHRYILVNVMYDWLPNLILGLEYNYGKKETTHTGSIDTGDVVLSRLEKGRDARRISFGLYFNY